MSWLARSIANTLHLDDDVEDEAEFKRNSQNDAVTPAVNSSTAVDEDTSTYEEIDLDERSNNDNGDRSDDDDQNRGVKEDLSELKETLTRQLWGVASFLAPPPPPLPPGKSDLFGSDGDRIEESGLIDGSEEEEGEYVGDGGGYMENSDCQDDQVEESENDAVGVTEEVLAFATNIAHHPETWLDFPFADEEEFDGSLFHYLFQQTEALQSKVGRYLSPEEIPFFPDNLPDSIIPPTKCTPVLHPAAQSVNVNGRILDIYINQILPLFCIEDDGSNFAATAACDIQLLQALSRRIHYGLYVAEVKFRDNTDDYKPFILAQDRDALMKLLTFEVVEEMVKKRVTKKAKVFGQQVTLNDDTTKEVESKVDPSLVSRLYDEWIMPLTKLVEVEYLLRRLD